MPDIISNESFGFISGVVVIGSGNNEKIIDGPLESLNEANVSAVVTSSRGAELMLSRHPNIFTTSPDLSSVKEVSCQIYRP